MELVNLSKKQLIKAAQEKKIRGRGDLKNKIQLIEALSDPERHNRKHMIQATSSRIHLPLIDIYEVNPKQGNYIKWWSRWVSRSCTGRFEGFLPNEYIQVSWIWDNKRVKKKVHFRYIMDYQDVRTV